MAGYVDKLIRMGERGAWGYPDVSAGLPTTGPHRGAWVETTGLGRLVHALEGLRTFTASSIALIGPEQDAPRVFERLTAWPAFEADRNEESGEDALSWTSSHWKQLKTQRSAYERRQVLEAAREVNDQLGWLVGRVTSRLLLGQTGSAEAIIQRDFRRFLVFAPPPLLELIDELEPDPGEFPALTLLGVEAASRRLGSDPGLRVRALQAARSIERLRVDDAAGELQRTALAAFGYTSAGRRSGVERFLLHASELTEEIGQWQLDAEGRGAVSGALYLVYWAALQTDRHDEALGFAELMHSLGDPADRLAPLEAVSLSTQRDLAGVTSLAGSQPPHPDDELSHATALRHLEDAADEAADVLLRPVSSRQGPMPSRSAIDALALLVRALARPDAVSMIWVRSVVSRSARLWGDHPSSFVGLGAQVACAAVGSREDADWLMAQVSTTDDFGALAEVFWAQNRGDHARAVEAAQRVADRARMPRFRVWALVLQAASLRTLSHDGAATAALGQAWSSHQAPRLIRFALRPVRPAPGTGPGRRVPCGCLRRDAHLSGRPDRGGRALGDRVDRTDRRRGSRDPRHLRAPATDAGARNPSRRRTRCRAVGPRGSGSIRRRHGRPRGGP